MDHSEILKALQAANSNVEKLAGQNAELKTRMLDLEQKADRRPNGGGGDANLLQTTLESSDAFRAMLKGQTKSARIEMPAKALQAKSIYSDVTGGYISQADRSPGIIVAGVQRLRMRELIPSVPTTQGSTEFLRESVATLNAGPQGGIASPTEHGGEGSTKNTSDLTLELVNSPVITIAHSFTTSRQALDDMPALQNHIETRGIFGWEKELEDEILLGTGAAGKLNGLVNNSTAFTGGATNQTKADTLRKSVTQLAILNHVATGIVLHPTDAEALELQKDSQQRYLGVVIFINGSPTIWRVPIVESNSMNVGTFLTGAFAEAATLRTRQEAHLEVSLDHSDYRVRNLALLLIEGRIGLEVHRPTAMVTGSLNYAG